MVVNRISYAQGLAYVQRHKRCLKRLRLKPCPPRLSRLQATATLEVALCIELAHLDAQFERLTGLSNIGQ